MHQAYLVCSALNKVPPPPPETLATDVSCRSCLFWPGTFHTLPDNLDHTFWPGKSPTSVPVSVNDPAT